MNRTLLNMLFTMLLCIASDGSLLLAETYQWTDADGSMHFSDTPPVKAPSSKQPIVKQDDMSITLLKSSKRSSTTVSAENRQPSRQQSWKPDAACLEEIRAFDKKLSKDENMKSCMDSVQSKSRQRYSPECLRQLEAKKYTFTAACQQEIQTVGQAIITELQHCAHMDTLINTNISSKCREQSERYQKHEAICGETVQKISRVCGQSTKCYEEHQADLADCR